jgi:putative transcriptional regulator
MIKIHLSKLLGERKMKQIDLIRKTGIRNEAINSYFHEYAINFKIEHMNKICKALNCKISDLIEYMPDDEK